MVCVGNDHQFRSMCEVIGEPELADDPRYLCNIGTRFGTRDSLETELEDCFRASKIG